MGSDRSWWSLTLEPLAENRERLEALLHDAGCAGIWEQEPAADGRARITAYFPGRPPAGPEKLAWWPAAAELTAGRPELDEVAERDWFKEWRENFAPAPLTDKTLVIPAWMEPEEGENRLVLKIYPGQGFGTGTHESTQLAASLLEEELSRRPSRPDNLLDVGTGSGILAILAARRGVKRITALDIDPDALANARENLAHNRVEEYVTLSRRPLAEITESYDLVAANIVAPVLRELVGCFPARLNPGGCLILSGMLPDQAAELARSCTALGLVCNPRRQLGEWSAFSCRKP